MLELLQNTASQLGLQFAFGGLDDLNLFADSVGEGEPNVLFYSCYQTVGLTETSNGYLTRSIPLELYILSVSEITDEPAQRYAHIDACSVLAVSIFKKLFQVYTLSNVRLDPIITQTNNPLDGVRLTATLLTNPESLC